MTSNTITGVSDLYGVYGCDPHIDALDRAIYKDTQCGAHIRINDILGKSVTLSTIVEGSDAEFERVLTFPFTLGDWGNTITEIESLAEEAWNEANDNGGSDPDGEDDDNLYHWLNAV